MEAEASGLVKGLNEVNSKYAESNKELQKQEAELQRLLDLEAKLQKGRANAANPNAIIKYNTELKNTAEQIKKVKESVENMAIVNGKAAKYADDLRKKMDDAFNATKINGFKNNTKDIFQNPIQQLQRLNAEAEKLEEQLGSAKTEQEFKRITDLLNKNREEAEKFRKALDEATKPPEKITGEFLRLKVELKAAKDALLQAFGTGNQKEIQQAAQKVGEIQDKINSLNDTVRNFSSGSKFKILGNLFRGIAGNILSLDFSQANEQSKQLLAVSKSITFKEALTGIKDLGSTLINVGKSLLLNPLFLLGTTVALVIANFDKLKTSGGLVGDSLQFLGKVVDGIKFAFISLTDAIGLTNLALQKFNEQKLEGLKKQAEVAELVAKRIIRLQNSLKLNTEQTEKDRLQIIINNAEAQLRVYKKLEKSRGELTKEEQEDYHALARTIGDARTEITAVENEGLIRRKEAAEAYARDIRKLFEDLNKRIQDESNKGKKFKVQTEFDTGSADQVKADFALRKKLEEDDIELTRKNAIESIETFKKAELEKRKDAISTKIIKEQAAKELASLEDQISRLRTRVAINRNRELQKALLDAEKKAAIDRLEVQKNANVSELETFVAENKLTEEEAAEERLSILIHFYDERIKLLEKQVEKEKKLGFSAAETQKELDEAKLKGNEEVAKALDAQIRLILKNSLARESEEQRHQDVMGQLEGDSESKRLLRQIEFEKKKLELLKKSNKATEQELKEQQNKIEELEVTAREKRIQENIGYFEQISNAAFDATEQVINAKIKEIEKLTELQEKRVQDAKDIAEEGNAELYELEQKRLDDLNKQREVFVKRQQALATIELIANTAIAVSKAAAQGGVAAAITIAAALIALTGGLLQARSIASQAAYYEGGYTGEGDPRKESRALGQKSYTYHNKEFVFNHEKTGKYRDIFEGIHRGDIDLADWKRKVSAYEQLRIGAMFQQKTETVNMEGMEKKLNNILVAIEGQSTSVNLNENGLSMRFKKIKTRNEYIRKNLGRA